MRTEAASKRYVEIVEGMSDKFGIDDFKVELDETVLESMKSFIYTRHIIKDMKVCLIKNKSKKNFIPQIILPYTLINGISLMKEPEECLMVWVQQEIYFYFH